MNTKVTVTKNRISILWHRDVLGTERMGDQEET